jgi:asparagine synthase (glutamine-hydrolysing)
MCGISGQFNFEPEHAVAPEILERMQLSLIHRGPDSQGMWIKDSVGLAHNRLAIIDLSENGKQPICNENGTVWIVYNGEVYNFHSLRDELESKGHRFVSQTDTEVIVHLYEEEGIQCLNRLRGMFAFAIWDKNERQLFLARDRFGQKPLYYYIDDEKLLFASEIDYQALYQYLCLGYVPHPNTGFRGIKKLPPGHYLVTDGAKIVLKPYWSLQVESSDNKAINETEVSQKLLDLLTEATQMRLVSDVPVGVLLSGGVDSNAVAAMMSRYSDQIKTFTVGSYYVAQMASQHVKVVLNGDGGDESFAGYGKYVQGMVGTRLQGIPASIGGFFSRILDQKRAGKAKSLSEVLALSGRSQASAFAQLGLVTPAPYVDSLINSNFKDLIGTENPLAHLLRCYEKHHSGDTVNTMLAVDRETYLPDDLLFKIDIATMSHGLEARSPFLDHHLVKYVAGLPGNLKLRGWKKKYILKQALRDVLPPQVLNRRKKGFDVPIGRWLKDELKETCRDALSDNGLIADVFEKNKLEKMFEDHLRGHKDWGRFFWMIVMLHLWFELFFEDGKILQ